MRMNGQDCAEKTELFKNVTFQKLKSNRLNGVKQLNIFFSWTYAEEVAECYAPDLGESEK